VIMTGPGIAVTATMAVVGAVVGESQVLCLNGQCVMTGTWIGGTFIGGAFGYLAAGALLPWKTKEPAQDEKDDA
jgi:hypothetical protein